MILHTNGGPLDQNTLYSWTRDMPYGIAQAIVEKYSSRYHIIQVGRDPGHAIPGTEFVNMQMTNHELFSTLVLSDKRVLIDSSLQHAAAAMKLKSTVLWVGTTPKNFGYELHSNITAKPPKGNVKMIEASWNRDFLNELRQFPLGAHDDAIDSLADAFNNIFKMKKFMAF